MSYQVRSEQKSTFLPYTFMTIRSRLMILCTPAGYCP